MDYKDTLKEQLKALNVSAYRLAIWCGCSQSTISLILSGKRHPSEKLKAKINQSLEDYGKINQSK